jgi:hypothetical protein
MRKVFLICALSIGAILAISMSAFAQEGPDTIAIELLRTVMPHRLMWLRDSTLYNACQIYEKLGRPENLAERLGPHGGPLLNRQGDPCAGPRPRGSAINLSSITVEDSIARVVLYVIRGEFGHEEEYTLRTPPPGGPSWAIEEVRLSGWTHYNPPPRSAPPP